MAQDLKGVQARHLAEFVMIEPEMAWCDLEGARQNLIMVACEAPCCAHGLPRQPEAAVQAAWAFIVVC